MRNEPTDNRCANSSGIASDAAPKSNQGFAMIAVPPERPPDAVATASDQATFKGTHASCAGQPRTWAR